VSIYFLDASALAKRYLVEIGTNWIRDICDPAQAHSIIASEITRVELLLLLRQDTVTNRLLKRNGLPRIGC
jgi:hypothetical protein